MRISTKPLSGFGMEISGVDLSGQLEPAVMREILQVFHAHGLIVIPHQEMTFDRYDALTMEFGRQKPHFLDHLRHENHPAILNLSNIFEDGNPIGVYEGAAFWHTDVAYPGSAQQFHGRLLPSMAGRWLPDLFCRPMTAYDDLPAKMKETIDSMTVLHHYGNRAEYERRIRDLGGKTDRGTAE